MSVREVEQLSQKAKKANTKEKPRSSQEEGFWGENFLKEMELALEGELGRKIRINGDPKTNGSPNSRRALAMAGRDFPNLLATCSWVIP